MNNVDKKKRYQTLAISLGFRAKAKSSLWLSLRKLGKGRLDSRVYKVAVTLVLSLSNTVSEQSG